MKNIAVMGTGAIGCLLGGYLTKNGVDVTMISAFRRETAEYMAENGLQVDGIHGDFHVPVKARFLDDLRDDEVFDAVFLALKSNDLVNAVTRLKPHLAVDGCVVTLQNGINEEFLTPIVGDNRVVAGISFAGGAVLGPGHVKDHDGHFVIGELRGKTTARTQELVEILSHARPAQAVENIREWQWDKLAAVSTNVPTATVSGQYQFETFDMPRCQVLFSYLALEACNVAAADGCPKDIFGGRTRAQWEQIRDTGIIPEPAEPRMPFPPKVVDAYTKDIRKGLELEIDHTNGAIVRLGKRYGVPTPANELLIHTIREIEAGRAAGSMELMESIISKLEAMK